MRRQEKEEEKPQYKEEEKPQYMGTSLILCKHCGKEIISTNYLIHQARCGLMSSRMYRSETEPEKFETKPRQKQPYPPLSSQFRREEIRPNPIFNSRQKSNVNFNYRQRPKIFEQKREEEEQKIPCPFCGYKQTLAELDTHPQTCEHRDEECPQCHQTFPKSLMSEHLQICSASRRPQQHQHPIPSNYEEYEEDEEQGMNPFGNFGNFLSMMGSRGQQPQMPPQMPPQNSHRRGDRGFIVLERRDGRGNVTRQVIPSGGMQEGFAQRGGAQYSPFTNFFALVEMLAGRHGSVDQGLTKEEIKGLKRIKYQGNNSKKNQNEKDICTICYCEFEKDEKLIELRCKHMYHEQCITKWVQKTAKCPVCKAPQTDRPIFENEDD